MIENHRLLLVSALGYGKGKELLQGKVRSILLCLAIGDTAEG